MSGRHGHEASPAHGHPAHPGQAENPWAGRGSVLLDIGGDVGALVVYLPADMTGVEVEIRPAPPGEGGPAHGHHPHVAVVARRVGAGTVPSLVYPELRAGPYELYEKGTDRVEMRTRVEGGRVTEATWPAPAPGGGGGGPSEDPDAVS